MRKASQGGGNHGYQIKLEQNKKRKASNDGRAAREIVISAGVGIKRTKQRKEQFMEGKMLSSAEKKTLSKAIEDIWDKAETVFRNFECEDVEERSDYMDIFLSMVDLAGAIRKADGLVERY